MRILCYSSYFLPYRSGITTTTNEILKYLSKKNEVKLLTFRYDKKLRETEKKDGFSIIRMPWNFRISKGFISFAARFIFLKEVKNTDIVIINLPNVEAFPLALFAKMYGKKIVVLYHCDVELSGGTFSYFVTQATRFFVFMQLLLSDRIAVYPDYLSEHWYKLLFRKKLTTMLPLFERPRVDESFKKKLLHAKRSKKWVGFVGRIASEKGVEYLIKASQNLKQKHISFELIFAGPEAIGEEKYRSRMLQMLEGSNVPYQILGEVTDPQLSSLYEVLDVLVIPSINRTEAISIVQLEAMSVGTPVVVTSLPGVRYPVQKTGMGLIVKPGDSNSLAEALQKVLKSKTNYSTSDQVKKMKEEFLGKNALRFYKEL